MTRLRESDYRKVLEVVYAVAEADVALPFPHPVLQTLRELVPCDVVTFHERSRSAHRVIVHTGEPQGEMTPEIRAAHRRLEREDPVRPGSRSSTLTDVVSMREFRRRDLYVEVHGPLGIEYLLWLYVDPARSDARLEFDRGDGDFSDRDRAVLDLLQPHLRQFLRAARRRLPAAPAAEALTPREREVIALVAEGRTNDEVGRRLDISPATVRKHLENAYEKLGVHTRTGAIRAAFGGRDRTA